MGFGPKMRQKPELALTEATQQDMYIDCYTSGFMSHTCAPHTTYTAILFKDSQTATGVRVKVEAGKGDPTQA